MRLVCCSAALLSGKDRARNEQNELEERCRNIRRLPRASILLALMLSLGVTVVRPLQG